MKTRSDLESDVAALRGSLAGLLRVYEFLVIEEQRSANISSDVRRVLDETRLEGK